MSYLPLTESLVILKIATTLYDLKNVLINICFTCAPAPSSIDSYVQDMSSLMKGRELCEDILCS